MFFLRRSLVGVFLMALSLAGIAWAASTVYTAVVAMMSEEERRRPNREVVLSVNVVPVQFGTETPVLETFGEIRARRTLDVRATSGGRVVALSEKFVDGGRVEAGELLATIDPSEAEADYALAEADVKEAEAELAEAVRAVSLAQDDLAVAREQAELRAQALARQEDLLGRGVGSASAVETAALAAAAARQQVVSRRQSLATAEARVDQAESRRDRSVIALAESERILEDTKIHAGFSGTLSEVTLVEGGLVSGNEQLARLVDPENLEVAFRLSTAQYARLLDDGGRLISAPVEVIMDVAGLRIATVGVIARESAAVGVGQTGREIFARLEQPAGFRPGDIVTVQITEAALERVARLPARALASDDTVLIVGDDDRLSERSVQLLRRQGDTVLVRARDLAGATIVAERTPLLGEGIRVNPLAPEGETSAPEPDPNETVSLSDEKRAELIAFVKNNNRMPSDVRDRLLGQLEQDEVPTRLVTRLEERMGS